MSLVDLQLCPSFGVMQVNPHVTTTSNKAGLEMNNTGRHSSRRGHMTRAGQDSKSGSVGACRCTHMSPPPATKRDWITGRGRQRGRARQAARQHSQSTTIYIQAIIRPTTAITSKCQCMSPALPPLKPDSGLGSAGMLLPRALPPLPVPATTKPKAHTFAGH